MLLGIALANVSVYLWGQPVDDGTSHLAGGNVFDRALSALVIVFIDQRSYPMFAFLFGYGIIQFAQSRWRAGVPEHETRAMLRRRHLWLLAFGAVHATLLFSGDILGAYGLTGLILTAVFWQASDRAMKITAWVLAGLAAFGSLLIVGAGAIFIALGEGAATDLSDLTTPSMADLITGQSNYLFAALTGLGLWLIMTPATVAGLLVPAAVLLGMLAARHRWLEGIGARMRLGAVAAWGIGISVVGALPSAAVYLGLLPALDGVSWSLTGLTQITGFVGGIGYAALFGLIGQRVRGELSGAAGIVAAIGKRSLTFYLLQSVIFAPLLSAWGLGWGASIGSATAYGLALAVWLVSAALAAVLERQRKRGPAEMLLRRLTYGRDPAPKILQHQ